MYETLKLQKFVVLGLVLNKGISERHGSISDASLFSYPESTHNCLEAILTFIFQT